MSGERKLVKINPAQISIVSMFSRVEITLLGQNDIIPSRSLSISLFHFYKMERNTYLDKKAHKTCTT